MELTSLGGPREKPSNAQCSLLNSAAHSLGFQGLCGRRLGHFPGKQPQRSTLRVLEKNISFELWVPQHK